MKILARVEKSKGCWFVLITSILFFLLRIPSFIEPYWYGDEGIYQVIGMALRNGRLLYRDIWDNKPPLLYVLYGIFSSDQFSIRLVSTLFGVGSVIIFFLLAQKLFKKQHAVFITTSIYTLLFALPLLEGNIANSENFMLLPILLAGLLVYKATDYKPETRKLQNFSFSYLRHSTYYRLLFCAGLLLSFAFLFKVVAIFDFSAFFVFLLFTIPRRLGTYIMFSLTSFLELIIGFFIPIILTILFFSLHGALSEFLRAAFIQNVGYVGYGNRLFFSQGLLILKLILLFGFIGFLFLKRHLIPKPLLFILVWFSFSFFNAYFSQRPYTHYVLVLLPSFCLLLGLCFDNPFSDLSMEKHTRLYSFLKNSFKKLIIGICVITIIMISNNFWLYKKNTAYYLNFFLFLTNQKTTSQYRSFFDSKTPRDYEIASVLNLSLKKDDTIFIWGNNAQLYKLTNTLPPGKYTVAYHMLYSEDTIQETFQIVSVKKPKYIVIMPDVPPIPYSLFGYSQKFMVNKAMLYERNF